MARWKPPIESVNYHIWRTCNMRCHFCFATYDSVLPAEYRRGLSLDEASRLVMLLAAGGFRKITFAGGEPTLCPYLPQVVAAAKAAGLVTGVVSNGSRLTPTLVDALSGNLDWLAVSIDSRQARTNHIHGRLIAGERGIDLDDLVTVLDDFRQRGVRLKVNTVVTRFNYGEFLLPLIERIRPERWKIMRVLRIDGENDRAFASLSVSSRQFEIFLRVNSPAPATITVAAEDNEDMINTYVIVDPAGRFIDNSGGRYQASDPLLDVGVQQALSTVLLNEDLFAQRGGLYDW
jgi:radical S-adenosyl methionine domain-containing protein 2